MSNEIIGSWPHTYTVGDTKPDIELTFDEQDLTGYTVELIIRRSDESELIKVATLTDPEQGKFMFEWAAGDLLAGFGQLTQLRFTLGADIKSTVQLFLNVRGTP